MKFLFTKIPKLNDTECVQYGSYRPDTEGRRNSEFLRTSEKHRLTGVTFNI